MSRKKKPVLDLKKAINMELPSEYYVALLVGLFFLFVSVQQVRHLPVFSETVYHWHLLPLPWVNVTALLVTGLELVAAFAVVFLKEWRRAGLWILALLLLVYTGVAGVNLLRGLNTPGGFFAFDVRMASLNHWSLVRNLALAAAALFALRR